MDTDTQTRPQPILPQDFDDPRAYATALFAAFDDKARVGRFIYSFAEDGWMQAGNAPREGGYENLTRDLGELLDFAPTHHHVTAAARSGDTLFVAADVDYFPKDATAVRIPSAIAIRLNGEGRIASMFVGMDRSPSHPLRDFPEELHGAPDAA